MGTGFFRRGPRPVRPHTRTFASISERLASFNLVLRTLITPAPEPSTRPRTYHQARQARWMAARRRNDDDWRGYGGRTRRPGNI